MTRECLNNITDPRHSAAKLVHTYGYIAYGRTELRVTPPPRLYCMVVGDNYS